MTEETTIEWRDGETVTAAIHLLDAPLFVFAHGAGTDQTHDSIVSVARALAGAGHGVMTFNYPYTEAGRCAPDRAPKLTECHLAVIEEARRLAGAAPIVGGRSMGGRISTMVAAEGVDVLGVVCLGYPLHPAGRPDRLRTAHLDSVAVPMLFFQGDRDALSRQDLFDAHIRPLTRSTVVDLVGADHSFRGWGWTPGRVAELVVEGYSDWVPPLARGFA